MRIFLSLRSASPYEMRNNTMKIIHILTEQKSLYNVALGGMSMQRHWYEGVQPYCAMHQGNYLNYVYFSANFVPQCIFASRDKNHLHRLTLFVALSICSQTRWKKNELTLTVCRFLKRDRRKTG